MAGRILRKYDARKGAWLKAGERFALLLVAVFLIFRFLVGVSWVSGHSMEPTLQNGSVVVYYRGTRHYQVGDVVAIKMAYGEYYIKRVVAREGDTVDLRDGILYVNGEPEDSPWAQGVTEPEGEAVTYPLRVAPGKLFVLGDNREESVDSRTFGPVSRSQARGRILFHLG